MRTNRSPRAFTLIELLVVIGIIIVLVGILVPGVGMVRAQMYATKSQSNLKQWGVAITQWGNAHKEQIPWEGANDTAGFITSIPQDVFWPNALGPLVGDKPYKVLVEDAFEKQQNVANWDNHDSVWTDPGARPVEPAPWSFGGAGADGITRGFWFCYAMNIRLNRTLLLNAGLPSDSFQQLIRMSHISTPDRTVTMLELRANPNELGEGDPFIDRNLDRAACSWKRFGARHFKGGHVLMADGHVQWFLNDQATTNNLGNRDPAAAGADWNTGKLTWDPLGPATD